MAKRHIFSWLFVGAIVLALLLSTPRLVFGQSGGERTSGATVTGSTTTTVPGPSGVTDLPAATSSEKRRNESFLYLAPGVTGGAFSSNASSESSVPDDLMAGETLRLPTPSVTDLPAATSSEKPRNESFLFLAPGVTGGAFSSNASSESTVPDDLIAGETPRKDGRR